ncbi:MAG: sulfatase-like hydrolase/transferase, partial [Candidatus Hydrogenedentes bacterium]|nr:sulfatase-like hydrolase/transferase [Candidatus Hydrogenedentota bacterium]
MAGLVAGGLIALVEAGWIGSTLSGFEETGIFTWGVVAYGLIFGAVGKGVAFGLLFIFLPFNRFPPAWWTYALSFAGTTVVGGMVIGLFRLRRDVYDGHMPDSGALIQLGLVVGSVALVGGALLLLGGRLLGRRLPGKPAVLVAGGLLAYGILLATGTLLGISKQPTVPTGAETTVTPPSGPNLILIAVDTLRADYLPAYNAAIETKTPNLDIFMGDAIRYEQGFSQASWTKASFGSIFSGMYPECHTAVTKTASLPEDVETVAELLQAGGYYTQGYANNPNIMSLFGYGQGFDEYVDLKKSLHFGASPSAARLSMYEVLLKVREVVNKRLGRAIRVTDYYQPAATVKDRVLAWLDDGHVPEGMPYFLFVHFMDPHDPFMDPEAPGGGYGRKRMGNPDPAKHLAGMRRAYIGEIEYLDQELGKFFAGLKERGIYDDALIVLTADHGEEFQEHGGWWHGQTLYDEQTHVPFVVKLPGNAHGGEVNLDFARNLDIAPTLLDFAGLEKGGMMQGQSLFDEARNPANGNIGYSYAENNFEGIVLQALRTGTHKLIRANEDNKRDLPPIALYDIGTDPGEQANLAGEDAEAEIQAQLNEGIDAYLKICEENAVEPAAPVVMDAETAEQLESLGYLGDDLE